MTQTELETEIKLIINSSPLNEEFNNSLIEELLLYHPEKKLQKNLKLKVMLNIYKTKTLYNKCNLQEFDSISYKLCVKSYFGRKTSNNNIKAAFRFAIKDNRNKFFEENTIDGKGACKKCLGIYEKKQNAKDNRHIQVDHVHPFKNILDKFVATENIKLENVEIEYLQNVNTKCIAEIKDKSLRQKWIHFHDNIAEYQLLCSTCNSRKSNKV